MIRILLSLWLALAPDLVWAGSMSLMGVGAPTASVSPPVATFISEYSATGTDPSFTATVSIGNPTYISTRRVIIMMVGGALGSGQTVSTCTINSVTCDVKTILGAGGGSGSAIVTIISAQVTSGTTSVSVAWTYSAPISGGPLLAVYTVNNSLLNSPTSPVTNFCEDVPGGHTTFSCTFATLSGGVVFMANWWGGSTNTAISSSTAGLTTDYYNASAQIWGSANGTAANASSSVTLTSSFSSVPNDLTIGFAAWR